NKAAAASPRKWFSDFWGSSTFDEAAGLIHLQSYAGTNHHISLNVPYYVVPTKVSKVKLKICGSCLSTGQPVFGFLTNTGGGIAGPADWFSWGATDPAEGNIGSADLLNAGI